MELAGKKKKKGDSTMWSNSLYVPFSYHIQYKKKPTIFIFPFFFFLTFNSVILLYCLIMFRVMFIFPNESMVVVCRSTDQSNRVD